MHPPGIVSISLVLLMNIEAEVTSTRTFSMTLTTDGALPAPIPQVLSVMQPYFFPYLGYFALIRHTDFFVAFDPVQYISKGWMNRNRVLKPTEGWQYLTAPVQKQPQDVLIKDVLVVPGDEWKVKVVRQLEHYKKRAPHYNAVKSLLEDCFNNPDLSLSRLNVHYLSKVCDYLKLPFRHAIFSELNLTLGPVEAPDEWALRTTQELGATTYVNQPGGRTFFQPAKYAHAGINLQFIDFDSPTYSQRRDLFEPGLSVLDVLMFNAPEQVRAMLDAVTIGR